MNPWTNPDLLPLPAAVALANGFTERAASTEQHALYAALIHAAAPQPGQRWLDLGCCVGTVTRQLATLVGAQGSVVGVDISAAMISLARERQQHPALRFIQADATSLPPDLAPFDGVTVMRLLLHVPDPLAVLQAARQAVRPGGRLVVLEWDWGTLALDHPNRTMTRRILDWRCDYLHGDNWIGRKLAGLAAASGWDVVAVQPHVTVARQEPSGLIDSLRHAAAAAHQAGVISSADWSQWLAELDAGLARGQFFASMNDYLVLAETMDDSVEGVFL